MVPQAKPESPQGGSARVDNSGAQQTPPAQDRASSRSMLVTCPGGADALRGVPAPEVKPMTLAERFRTYAGSHTHLYGYALRAMADDIDEGGPTGEIVRDWQDAPRGSVVQLRLLAGVFRIVLTGRAPSLEPYYPCLGGTEPPQDVWPAMQAVLSEHSDELRQALQIAPQTNEVGRSVPLLAGLFDLGLTSFVWPFDLERHERLAAALRTAHDHPPVVDRGSASAWLADQLEARDPDPATLIAVWHSVTQLYWTDVETARVDQILQQYGSHHAIGEIAMEFDRVPPQEEPYVLTRLWRGDGSPPRVRRVGTAHDHGIPLRTAE